MKNCSPPPPEEVVGYYNGPPGGNIREKNLSSKAMLMYEFNGFAGEAASRPSCSWLPGVVDGGCLLLVIAGSGVDQGGVGGPGTPPSGWA